MDSPMHNQSKGVKMKVVTIPNWSQFGVKVAGVVLYRFDQEETPVYQAAFTLFLDNSEVIESDEDQQAITIFTENTSTNPYELATETANLAAAMWHEISSDVPIIDEDGEVYQVLDLNKISDKIETAVH